MEHNEAKVIAYTSFVVKGVQINFTMREGATADETIALLREFGLVTRWLKNDVGAIPILGRDAVATGNGISRPRAEATEDSSPPPTTPASNGSNGNNGNQIELIDSVKITAPKGKPVVEFWRRNRRYPELRWHLGGEKLLAVAPTLAAANWRAEHFDDIGQEYPLNLKVSWIQSPRDEKYKDITAIELVA